MYKDNLAVNNLQWLISQKIQPDQTKPIWDTNEQPNPDQKTNPSFN